MHKLSLRVAGDKDLFFYDLADSEWRAIQIEPTGWSLLEKPPVIFRRRKNTCGQVLPLNGGNLDMLKTYINLKDQNDWILLNALIVSSFVPDIPHPISVFYGDKGSAKTTAQRVLRKLIDPAHRDTMTLPTNKNELVLILMTNYSPCFDNLDGINPWQSDILCQAATGGGISKRELYTDVDEVIMSFLRCPMLNGINNIVTRDDLLDRSVLFQLERIDPSRRKEDAVFWEEFERERPYILGAILDTLAKAMNIRPKNNLNRLPRMADFARWGFAITEALGESGEAFIAAYEKNIAQANEEAIQADIVAIAICELMSGRVEWESSMTELLEELSTTPGIDAKSKGWPKRPHALSRQINKMKSSLMDIGIEVERYRNDSARCIRITKPPKMESLASIESDANESCALATDTKPEHAIESAMQASV